MKNLLKAALDAWLTSLYLVAAEARTGIELVEAEAANDWRNDLASVTTSAEERQTARDLAITAMQLGIRNSAELEEAIRTHFMVKARGITARDIHDLGEIKSRSGR